MSAPAICVVFEGDQASSAGRRYAALQNKHLLVVSKSGKYIGPPISGAPKSILMIASRALSCRKGWGFFRRIAVVLSSGSSDVPWGLITCQEQSELEGYLERLSDCGAYGSDDTSRRESIDFAKGHGRSYCADSGRLCTSMASSYSLECSNIFTCVFPARKVPERRSSALIVVIDSCCAASLLQAGPESSGLRNIALEQIRRGALAVIAPHATQIEDEGVELVARTLASLGYAAGAIASTLNDFIRRRHGESGDFVVLGDPDFLPAASKKAVEVAPWTVSAFEWQFELPYQGDEVGVFYCASPDLLAVAALPLHVISSPLGIVLLRERDRILLLVRGMRRDRISVRLTSVPPLSEEDLRSVSSLAGLFPVRARDETLESMLGEAEVGFGGMIGGDTSSEAVYRYLSGFRTELFSAAKAASRRLADTLAVLPTEGFWLFRHLSNTRGVRFEGFLDAERKKCPHCDLALRSRPYRTGHHPADNRILLECERCMLVADHPRSCPPFYVFAPAEVGTDQKFTVLIRGGAWEEFRHGAARVCIDLLDQGRASIQIQEILESPSLDADGFWEFQFDIKFSEGTIYHLYNIHAIVIVNGKIFWGQARVSVLREDQLGLREVSALRRPKG